MFFNATSKGIASELVKKIFFAFIIHNPSFSMQHFDFQQKDKKHDELHNKYMLIFILFFRQNVLIYNLRCYFCLKIVMDISLIHYNMNYNIYIYIIYYESD